LNDIKAVEIGVIFGGKKQKMNCIQFYNEVCALFSAEEILDGVFTDAKLVRNVIPGVQLIKSNGDLCSPWVQEADDIHFDEPLSGPFFRLPIVGLYLEEKKPDRVRWYPVRAVVELPNSKLTYSSAIWLKATCKFLKQELGRLCEEKWYNIDVVYKIIQPLGDE
jgi:hypothetical protein